jgi:hypothetical protein
MKIVIDTRKSAEQAQILKLSFSYRNAIACGPNLSYYSNKVLNRRLVDLQTLIALEGPSKWFFDTFVNKVGNFGGISFVCDSTSNGYVLDVKNLVNAKEADREIA